MANPEIQWADVEPGTVVMGSDDRSVLFGGMGPRHEVSIGYAFRISTRPVEHKDAASLVISSDAEVASESEWELANSQGMISAEDDAIEELADSAQNYWGKVCDGRPHINQSSSPKILRKWLLGGRPPPSASPARVLSPMESAS